MNLNQNENVDVEKINSQEIKIDEDDLVLFNDVDMHWSQKNESTQDRVAISFNML